MRTSITTKLLHILFACAVLFAVSCEGDAGVDNSPIIKEEVNKDEDKEPDDDKEPNVDPPLSDKDANPSDFAQYVELKGDKVTATNYIDTFVELDATWLTINNATISQIINSAINLKNADARILLPEMKYDEWEQSGLKSKIYVEGDKIEIGVNARLKPYYDHLYIQPIIEAYEPAILYSGSESAAVEHSKIYTGSMVPLGGSVDKILLKRGHQIVVAASEDGTKSSRCFVAVENDLEIDLDATLRGSVRFARVLAVNFITKRSSCGLKYKYQPYFDFGWFYNWTTNATGPAEWTHTTFLPMCNNGGSVSEANFTKIINGEYPLLMTFNEPDNKDQANLSVDQAIELYRKLHKLGVRLGSPSTEQTVWSTDPSNTKWINEFMRRVKEEGLRVDVMGVHWYDIGRSAGVTVANAPSSSARFLSNLKQCYDTYGRPVIITEWNCAGPGSASNRDWDVHSAFFRDAVPKMEACDYVEGYSLYPPAGIINMLLSFDGGKNYVGLGDHGKDYFCVPSTPALVCGDDSRGVK